MDAWYLSDNDDEHPQTTTGETMNNEEANLIGMAHGVDAYNDAMGWSTDAPGPCGHHCTDDCPRCGLRLVKITDESGDPVGSVEVARWPNPKRVAREAFQRMLEEEDTVEWHTLDYWYCTIDGRTFRHEVTSNAVEVK
jgi:hypothetical protein